MHPCESPLWRGAMPIGAAVLFAVLLMAAPAMLPAQENTAPLAGRALKSRLSAEVSWRQSAPQPVGDAIAKFCRAQQVACLLDRRVDKSRQLQVDLSRQPLADAVTQLADQARLGVTWVRSLAYFGPPEQAAELRTAIVLAQHELEAIPRERQIRLARLEPLSWPMLSEPRSLVAAIAQNADLQVENIEVVPHDLWAAAELPPLSALERLSIVLHGFDLTVQVQEDGQRVRIVPLERPLRIVRDYRAGAAPGQVAARLRELLPQAEFRVARGRLYVRGRVEHHEQVQAALAGEPVRKQTPSKPEAGETLYTLTVKNKPLLPVLRQVLGQMQLELQLDQAVFQQAGVELDTLISFQVERASQDELLAALLGAAGLGFRIDGKKIMVTAKK